MGSSTWRISPSEVRCSFDDAVFKMKPSLWSLETLKQDDGLEEIRAKSAAGLLLILPRFLLTAYVQGVARAKWDDTDVLQDMLAVTKMLRKFAERIGCSAERLADIDWVPTFEVPFERVEMLSYSFVKDSEEHFDCDIVVRRKTGEDVHYNAAQFLRWLSMAMRGLAMITSLPRYEGNDKKIISRLMGVWVNFKHYVAPYTTPVANGHARKGFSPEHVIGGVDAFLQDPRNMTYVRGENSRTAVLYGSKATLLRDLDIHNVWVDQDGLNDGVKSAELLKAGTSKRPPVYLVTFDNDTKWMIESESLFPSHLPESGWEIALHGEDEQMGFSYTWEAK